MKPVVVLSDLHLGQTRHSMIKGTWAYKTFFQEMKELKEKYGTPRFVLAGDIFDLWRAYAKDCVPYGRDLFQDMAAMTDSPDDIVYIPGNHDHFIKQKVFGRKLLGDTHFSKIKIGRSDTLKALKLLGVDFRIVYPDYVFVTKNKKFTVTHGHFLTEEVFVDDIFVRFYLLVARIMNSFGPSREKLEKRKIWTYEKIFKRLVKTFDSSKKKSPYSKKTKDLQQKNYNKEKSNKIRDNWEIMNMRRTDWKMTTDHYISGHTHLPGHHRPNEKFKMPYVNSGLIHDNHASYVVIIDGTILIKNVGGTDVCKRVKF